MTSWMRDPSALGSNSEDYLLGKEIEKNFDPSDPLRQGTLGQINAVEYDCTPESIFSSRAEHQVDLQRKLQEDPLLSIKKYEVDKIKKVLDNPIRLKQLKEYAESVKKKSKKHKKEKKKKKSKDKDSDSEDEVDIDQLLLKKLGHIPPSAPEKPRERSADRHRSRSRSPGRRRPPPPQGRPRGSRSRSRSPGPSKRHHRPEARRSRSRSRERDSRRRRSPPAASSSSSSSRRPAASSSRISDKEREERLREMMSNAQWREEQRTKNVKHFKELDEKEEREHKEKHDPAFLRKQLQKAAETGTVEKRIQSNRHNIQRGSAHMDKNFAKR